MPASSSRILAKGAVTAAVLGVLLTGAYFLIYKGPKEIGGATKDGIVDGLNKGYDLAKRAGGDIATALQFQPKVVVGEKTVLERTSQLTELVTATRLLEHTYSFEHSWAGSTKRLELKGQFMAKAGFPVDESFAVYVSEDGQSVTVRHAAPKLIACELLKVSAIVDENGWWNKLNSDVREAAQNELLIGARKAAAESDLLAEATRNLTERLKPLQQKHSFTIKDGNLP